MQQAEFELLVKANAVRLVFIEDAGGGSWAIGINPGEKTCALVETARGGERWWRSLDVAHRWIRARGYQGDVLITGEDDAR